MNAIILEINEDFCKNCLDIIYDEDDSIIYNYAIDDLDEFVKEVVSMNSCIENILYNNVFEIKSNIDMIEDGINEIDNFIK